MLTASTAPELVSIRTGRAMRISATARSTAIRSILPENPKAGRSIELARSAAQSWGLMGMLRSQHGLPSSERAKPFDALGSICRDCQVPESPAEVGVHEADLPHLADVSTGDEADPPSGEQSARGHAHGRLRVYSE